MSVRTYKVFIRIYFIFQIIFFNCTIVNEVTLQMFQSREIPVTYRQAEILLIG